MLVKGNRNDLNWYPGHMTRTKRDLQDKLNKIEMVIEVLDARAPLMTRNPEFEDLFRTKRRMIILNKSDLANPQITREWVRYFQSMDIFTITYSAKLNANSKEIIRSMEKACEPIRAKYLEKGINKTVRALICGIPNVGKSAILNRICGQRRLKEGDTPGLTRGLNWVKLSEYLECMDSPGLLWPRFEDRRTGEVIALLGSINRDIIDNEDLAFTLIDLLRDTSPDLLTNRYKLTDLDKPGYELVEDICRKRGFLRKGGECDTDRCNRMLLEEFRTGKMGTISLERPVREDD